MCFEHVGKGASHSSDIGTAKGVILEDEAQFVNDGEEASHGEDSLLVVFDLGSEVGEYFQDGGDDIVDAVEYLDEGEEVDEVGLVDGLGSHQGHRLPYIQHLCIGVSQYLLHFLEAALHGQRPVLIGTCLDGPKQQFLRKPMDQRLRTIIFSPLEDVEDGNFDCSEDFISAEAFNGEGLKFEEEDLDAGGTVVLFLQFPPHLFELLGGKECRLLWEVGLDEKALADVAHIGLYFLLPQVACELLPADQVIRHV